MEGMVVFNIKYFFFLYKWNNNLIFFGYHKINEINNLLRNNNQRFLWGLVQIVFDCKSPIILRNTGIDYSNTIILIFDNLYTIEI